MSYDFRLFRSRQGEELLETARREPEEMSAAEPDPKKETLKQVIADKLKSRNPKFEILRLDYGRIARNENISVDEASRRYRHIELTDTSESSDGIQITLFDDEASVTVPYCHEPKRAVKVFREIWGCMVIMAREGGYFIYDPQIDAIIDPNDGFEDTLMSYTQTVQQVRRMFAEGKAVKKPWWKFW